MKLKIYVTLSQCAVKIWLPVNDLKKSQNWVNGEPQKDCRGLILPWSGVFFMDDLTVKEMVLPNYGMIVIGDNLQFEDKAENKMNCVQLKYFEMFYWSDINNWKTLDENSNKAVPHNERVPCQYDDVIFPAGLRSSPCVIMGRITLRSLTFGSHQFWEDINTPYHSELINSLIVADDIKDIIVTNRSCVDPTGCQCHSHNEDMTVCQYVPVDDPLNCLNPIKPIGFCTEICGASLLLEPRMEIAKIKEIMKNFRSDSYISKVKNGNKQAIQIILAEKEFDGTSLDEAKELHRLLSKQLYSELFLSGPYYKEGEQFKNALSLMFGTLSGVLLVFLLIFIFNGQRCPKTLRINSRPLSSYTGNLFARYDNSENIRLFCERQSIAGSSTNLQKSFENPMYGKTLSSTPSTSTDTINLKDGETEEIKLA